MSIARSLSNHLETREDYLKAIEDLFQQNNISNPLLILKNLLTDYVSTSPRSPSFHQQAQPHIQLCDNLLQKTDMFAIIRALNEASQLKLDGKLGNLLSAFFSYYPAYFFDLNKDMRDRLSCEKIFYAKMQKIYQQLQPSSEMKSENNAILQGFNVFGIVSQLPPDMLPTIESIFASAAALTANSEIGRIIFQTLQQLMSDLVKLPLTENNLYQNILDLLCNYLKKGLENPLATHPKNKKSAANDTHDSDSSDDEKDSIEDEHLAGSLMMLFAFSKVLFEEPEEKEKMMAFNANELLSLLTCHNNEVKEILCPILVSIAEAVADQAHRQKITQALLQLFLTDSQEKIRTAAVSVYPKLIKMVSDQKSLADIAQHLWQLLPTVDSWDKDKIYEALSQIAHQTEDQSLRLAIYNTFFELDMFNINARNTKAFIEMIPLFPEKEFATASKILSWWQNDHTFLNKDTLNQLAAVLSKPHLDKLLNISILSVGNTTTTLALLQLRKQISVFIQHADEGQKQYTIDQLIAMAHMRLSFIKGGSLVTHLLGEVIDDQMFHRLSQQGINLIQLVKNEISYCTLFQNRDMECRAELLLTLAKWLKYLPEVERKKEAEFLRSQLQGFGFQLPMIVNKIICSAWLKMASYLPAVQLDEIAAQIRGLMRHEHELENPLLKGSLKNMVYKNLAKLSQMMPDRDKRILIIDEIIQKFHHFQAKSFEQQTSEEESGVFFWSKFEKILPIIAEKIDDDILKRMIILRLLSFNKEGVYEDHHAIEKVKDIVMTLTKTVKAPEIQVEILKQLVTLFSHQTATVKVLAEEVFMQIANHTHPDLMPYLFFGLLEKQLAESNLDPLLTKVLLNVHKQYKEHFELEQQLSDKMVSSDTRQLVFEYMG